jgi:outer membrane protein assembly factor BamA
MVNVGRGRDRRFVSSDRIYSEAQAPGIQNQTDFVAGGGVIQYDWRDNPGGPRRGGNYSAEFTRYTDLSVGLFSFNRLNLEAQQYISFFNQRRVLALRARVQAADATAGQRVPFYLQPTLGGGNDLRGFRSFRFYDNSSIVLNGEYRWEVFSGLDMALFADAGKVFPDWRLINLRTLEKDFGFGFRFNVRNDVFLRIDTGFSREGFQVWVKFNNVF